MITIIFTSMTNQSQLGIIMWLKKTIAQQHPSTHAALRVCMDAVIAREKKNRTKANCVGIVALSMVWVVVAAIKLA